jgi:hypothetical protein
VLLSNLIGEEIMLSHFVLLSKLIGEEYIGVPFSVPEQTHW